MSGLNYNHLRYFWMVAREGHLGRAAQRLNLTQSALSVQIKRLEEQLGHRLFERAGRGLLLTEAGRIARDHADVIFATGDDLLGTLRESGLSRHVLRVGAQATLSRNFQLAFLRPILGRPDVEVVLKSGATPELLRALAAHQLDAVLTNQPPAADPRTRFPHPQARRTAGQPGRSPRPRHGRRQLRGPARAACGDPAAAAYGPAGRYRRADRPGGHHAADRRRGRRHGDDAPAGARGRGLGVLPPIVIQDELAQGILAIGASLPGIVERFYAVTVARTFRNVLLQDLLGQQS